MATFDEETSFLNMSIWDSKATTKRTGLGLTVFFILVLLKMENGLFLLSSLSEDRELVLKRFPSFLYSSSASEIKFLCLPLSYFILPKASFKSESRAIFYSSVSVSLSCPVVL